jgi:hypothetical protein
MKKVIFAAILAATSLSSQAYQVDEKDYNMLAYKEDADGTVTIMRNQRGSRCPTELFAMYQIQTTGEIVHGCFIAQKDGNFLIFYGANYSRQMLMKMKDFRAGPAYRGKYKELKD